MCVWLTWHAGDAQHVRVADVKAIQQLRGLCCIEDNDFSGGLCAGADPNMAGNVHLCHFSFLLLTYIRTYTWLDNLYQREDSVHRETLSIK